VCRARFGNFLVLYGDNLRGQIRICPVVILAHVQAQGLYIDALLIHLLQAEIDVIDINFFAQDRII